MTTSLKTQLEIRKLTAESEKAELEVARLRREVETTEANFYTARTYSFIGDVSENNVKYCLQTLGEWRRQPTGGPINMVFNSPGGSVIQGLALYDYIRDMRASGIEVNTTSFGYAASMAGVLLQSGDRRYMTENSYMMIHEVSSGTYGKVAEMRDDIEFSERLWEKCLDILVERSNMTKRQLKNKVARKDWWLSAEEALKFGFVDEIVGGLPAAPPAAPVKKAAAARRGSKR